MENDFGIFHTGCCSKESGYLFNVILASPITNFIAYNEKHTMSFPVENLAADAFKKSCSTYVRCFNSTALRWIDNEIVIYMNPFFTVDALTGLVDDDDDDEFKKIIKSIMLSLMDELKKHSLEKDEKVYLLPTFSPMARTNNVWISVRAYVENNLFNKNYIFEHTSLKNVMEEGISLDSLEKNFKAFTENAPDNERISDQILLEARRVLLDNIVKTSDNNIYEFRKSLKDLDMSCPDVYIHTKFKYSKLLKVL